MTSTSDGNKRSFGHTQTKQGAVVPRASVRRGTMDRKAWYQSMDDPHATFCEAHARPTPFLSVTHSRGGSSFVAQHVSSRNMYIFTVSIY